MNPPAETQEEALLLGHLRGVWRAREHTGSAGADDALLQHVRGLLEEVGMAETDIGVFLATPEKAGDRIGNFKLLELLGEGGFGVVWLAEQEKPVRRQVALKIIKLGMDTRQFIARFEQERQALAMMDHPGIAKVFDAGATQSGRPFFVMEFVRGVRITDYCAQEKMSVPQRLDLFVNVCRAVQHAHQKGIIHRDLKPSNIMVTLQDGGPVPKIIDFGVAKATQETQLTDITLLTQADRLLGTPLYMSPEQAECGSVDIDTRSDIYSLGVLLYELLTGRTPFDPTKLKRGGIDEWRRVVREEEPRKPSAHDPKLRGDLDCIVMKTLEKNRTRRYETANSLALDIQRYLRSEPVTARRPSFGYKTGRFVRKYRVGVIAAATVLVVLLSGLVASTYLYLREKDAWVSEAAQRKEAERHAAAETAARQEAEATVNFLTEVFQSPDPARDGRTIAVTEILDRAVEKLESELGRQPATQARLRATLAATYFALGIPRNAIPLYEKVREYQVANLGLGSADTLRTTARLASCHGDAGHPADALRLREEVLPLFRKNLGPEHPDTLRAVTDLAYSFLNRGRLTEAITLNEEFLISSGKVFGEENTRTAGAMDQLGICYARAGRLAEAINLQKEGLAIRLRVCGPKHPSTLRIMGNLASTYSAAGQHAKSLALSQELLRLSRNVLGQERYTLGAARRVAFSSAEVGRLDEAVTLQEEAVTLTKKVLGQEHPDTLEAINELASIYANAGRQTDALRLRLEVLPLQCKVLGSEHPIALWARGELAESYADMGYSDEAFNLRKEVFTLSQKVLAPEHPSILSAMADLAKSYTDNGNADEALKLREDVLRLRREAFDPKHPDILNAMAELAKSYATDNSRNAAALELQEEALKLRREVLGWEHRDTLCSMSDLAASYHEIDRKGNALKLRQELLALRQKVRGREHPETLETMSDLASSYAAVERPDAALKLREEVLMLQREVREPEHPSTLRAMKDLADSYIAAGRVKDGLRLLSERRFINLSVNAFFGIKVSLLQDSFGEDANAFKASSGAEIGPPPASRVTFRPVFLFKE